jgi:hypothetical protein
MTRPAHEIPFLFGEEADLTPVTSPEQAWRFFNTGAALVSLVMERDEVSAATLSNSIGMFTTLFEKRLGILLDDAMLGRIADRAATEADSFEVGHPDHPLGDGLLEGFVQERLARLHPGSDPETAQTDLVTYGHIMGEDWAKQEGANPRLILEAISNGYQVAAASLLGLTVSQEQIAQAQAEARPLAELYVRDLES